MPPQKAFCHSHHISAIHAKSRYGGEEYVTMQFDTNYSIAGGKFFGVQHHFMKERQVCMKKMRRKVKRTLSMLLAFVMLCNVQCITAFARTTDTTEPQTRGADISTGDIISFGSYPQTEVKGSALTNTIMDAEYDSNGDAEVDGVKYRRVRVTSYVTDDEYEKFCQENYPDGVEDWKMDSVLEECENAKKEREGKYRYFKWEPVRWKVLKNEEEAGTLFIMADTALDAVDYYDYSDGVGEALWEECTLRKWMNTDAKGFYHMAFNDREQEAIKVSTNAPEKGDRIYLLSDEEVKNTEYGFEDTDKSSAGRRMMASAYAEARGASVYNSVNLSCSWLLRTPGQWQYVKNVDFAGGIRDSFVIYHSQYLHNPEANRYERTFDGCVPALHVDISYIAPEVSPTPEVTPTSDTTPTPDTTPTSDVTPTSDATPTSDVTPTSEPSGDGSSSDKSILKSLNFDIPEDSAYKQDALNTETKSMSTMSELVLAKAGAPDSSNKLYIYDNDKNKGIRDDLNAPGSITDSFQAGDALTPYVITETIDADGDGKKELLAELSLNGVKRGQAILLKLTDLRTKKNLFSGYSTGGYINTTDDIPPWALEGLLSMCAGDFDGDGYEELAVYTPNNKDETASGSTANTLQIKIYKFDSGSDKVEPQQQQVIDVARVGGAREDCQGWLYSHVGGKKQYYSLPYMELATGDINKDGIDDLLTVANFSSTWRGAGLKDTITWKQLTDPNTCLGSVLDVYRGKRQDTDSLEQIVKKRVLVGRDANGGRDWNNGAGVLRNARAVVANVTGANSNEIVIAGNYTGITYDNTVTENTTVTKSRYVWIKDGEGDEPKLLVGYVTAQGLLADNSAAASLSYNWTIQEDGYRPLHYYNGYKNSLDAGSEPVELDGFAAYGSEQPDTIAIEGQLFNYSEDDNKLKCHSYETPSNVGKNKSNVWISAQKVGNVTNDPFGRETLYYTNCQKKSGKEVYWNDTVAVWGVVNADGTKKYEGKCMGDGKSSSAIHYTFAMCDIDEDSSLIKYEAGNTDVYYSNVQVLSVLQAAPVYGDLGDDYVSDAETSYGNSKGSSVGAGQTHQVSAGLIVGFEHETSFLGLSNLFSMEVTGEVAVTAGWEFEKTAEKEFTTSYNTSGTEDVAVLYTVPYVRYNGRIYIPTYTLPTREEYDAKKAFSMELRKNIERYQDIKAGVVGGTYEKPKDGYNNDYTTNVTKDNYNYQLRVYANYIEWLQQTESQMEGFEGSKGLVWGQEIEGGWEDYFFCVPQTPIITSVTADTYNKIAEGCSDLQSLYGTALPESYVAGRPETYVSNLGELNQRTTVKADSVETGKTNAGENGELGDGFISSTAISASSSSPSQTIAFSEENAKTTSIGGSASLEVVATVGDIKGGVSVSTEHEASWSRSTTSGCEFSGQVPNLPQRPDYMTQEQYGNYDYAWKLVAYEAQINGADVPVVGYYTKYADRSKIPPSVPENPDFEEVKSDSITLSWMGGGRPADHYIVYQVSGKNADKEYNKVGLVSANEEGEYRFTHENLQQEQQYTYVVAASNEDESVLSVYTGEVTTTTPTAEFDVTIGLDGIDSGETYLAGDELTLKAGLVTQNYPQSEIDQYIWQVNDGNGWRKLADGEDKNSYTWKATAEADGYQYRCGAYVAVDSRLYRLFSEPVTLHVRKAQVQAVISADKKEGAIDHSTEFGLAAYDGDVLKLAAQVEAEEGVKPSGDIEFVITDCDDSSNVRKIMAPVTEEGRAETECRFRKTGKYMITVHYVENERIQETISDNSLSYYAYDISQKDDRDKGRELEDDIYKELDDLTIENAIARKDEIATLKESYNNLTDSQKEFVESGAKEKIDGAEDVVKAAETVETIHAVGTVTEENAVQKKELIDEAQKAYNALTDAQKALVPDEVKNTLKTMQEDYEKATEKIPTATPTATPTPTPPDNKPATKKPVNNKPTNNKVKSDGTENLTAQQKKQVDGLSANLGLSKAEAVTIWKFAESQGIEMDTLLLTEETILKTASDKDVRGSVYGRLQAQAKKAAARQVKLKWKKIKGADGYLIYCGECGKKSGYKLVKKIEKGSAKSFKAGKLKKGKGYRFIVRAYKKAGTKLVTVSASKAVHVVTNGGKKTNAKNIKLGKLSKKLKKGGTLKLKASIKKQKKSTPTCRKLSFESSDNKVAAVTGAGTIKAKSKGKCTIYIYAHNGLCKQVKITVR